MLVRSQLLLGAAALCGLVACASIVKLDSSSDSDPKQNITPPPGRLEDAASVEDAKPPTTSFGAVVLYTFRERQGARIHDVSGVAPPLDLEATTSTGGAGWTDAGLSLSGDGARFETAGPAAKLTQACKTSNELSIEAWVAPAASRQGGPARVVTVSKSASDRNLMLGIGNNVNLNPADAWVARIGTASTTVGVVTAEGTVTTSMQHVVVTGRAPGAALLYVDGIVQARATLETNFAGWDETSRLMIGGELNASDRRFRGTYALIAVYCRELAASEISALLSAGAWRTAP